MDFSAMNDAYRNYVEQAKEAMKNGNKKRARDLFMQAAKVTNDIALNISRSDLKTEYYNVTKTLLDFVKNNCYEPEKLKPEKHEDGPPEDENDGKKGDKSSGVKIEEVKPLTLDKALSELNLLIGLDEVKNKINEWVNQVKIFNERKKEGLKCPPINYHMVFTGNPGTGKTTVARIISQIYFSMGILSKGQLVEVDRKNLVAGYVGQTAIKTGEVIKKAMGGVLFIDEAYSLVKEGGNDFGMEAIETLLKAMEDNSNDLAVVIAGYDDLMAEFFNSNPGLPSRFKNHIKFDDYKPNELYEIFKLNCQKNDYIIDASAEERLMKFFDEKYNTRNKNFGNGRFVRNIFENTVTKQSNRIVKIFNDKNLILDKKTMMTIIAEDLDLSEDEWGDKNE